MLRVKAVTSVNPVDPARTSQFGWCLLRGCAKFASRRTESAFQIQYQRTAQVILAPVVILVALIYLVRYLSPGIDPRQALESFDLWQQTRLAAALFLAATGIGMLRRPAVLRRCYNATIILVFTVVALHGCFSMAMLHAANAISAIHFPSGYAFCLFLLYFVFRIPARLALLTGMALSAAYVIICVRAASTSTGLEDTMINLVLFNAAGWLVNRVTEARERLLFTKSQQLRRLRFELAKQTHIARAANRAKSQLLTNASHDLSQPAHALAMLGDRLHASASDPGQSKLADRVVVAAANLEEMCANLLALARTEDARIVPATKITCLKALVQRVVDEQIIEAESKGLTVQAEVPAIGVHTDPLLVARVLRNLLTNAVRYTRVGGIAIAADAGHDRITITIRDSGVGVDPTQRREMFETNQRAGATAIVGERRGPGRGLGLAIVKRIDELLDLRLRFDSTPGKGSVFSFELPIADPPATTTQPI
jgi:signal transduction histidine kinase